MQEQLDDRRLAGTRRADEEDELALLNADSDIVERGARSLWVSLRDVFEANHGSAVYAVSTLRQAVDRLMRRFAAIADPSGLGKCLPALAINRRCDVGNTGPRVRHGYAAFVSSCCLRHRIPASINPSMSPSNTAAGLPVSCSVRRSFTIWYGWST